MCAPGVSPDTRRVFDAAPYSRLLFGLLREADSRPLRLSFTRFTGWLSSFSTALRLGETKTPKSRRTLTIPAVVLAALEGHPRRQLEEKMRARRTWVDTGLVFTTEIGTPQDPANLRREFAKLTEKAGLGRPTPNEFRHSTPRSCPPPAFVSR